MLFRIIGFVAQRLGFQLLGLAFALSYYLSTRDMKSALTRYPYVFLVTLVLLLIADMASEAWSYRQQRYHPLVKSREELRRPLTLLAACAGYALLMPWLGFVSSTFLFVAGAMWLLGERRPLRVLSMAGLLVLVCIFLFRSLLQIPLPSGLLA